MTMLRQYTILSLLIFLVIGLAPTTVFANFGLDKTAGTAGLDTSAKDIPTIVGNIVGTGLSLIGVAFFVLTLYGGFLWMTAHGNDETIKKALKIITAAIIGLVIVMASYALTTFIFNSLGAGGGTSTTPGSTPGSTPAPAQCIGNSSAPECAGVNCANLTVQGCVQLGTVGNVSCCVLR